MAGRVRIFSQATEWELIKLSKIRRRPKSLCAYLVCHLLLTVYSSVRATTFAHSPTRTDKPQCLGPSCSSKFNYQKTIAGTNWYYRAQSPGRILPQQEDEEDPSPYRKALTRGLRQVADQGQMDYYQAAQKVYSRHLSKMG